jgi:hypothetical protein
MTGKSLTGKGILLGGESILRRRIYFCGKIFYGDLWGEEFDFGGFW